MDHHIGDRGIRSIAKYETIPMIPGGRRLNHNYAGGSNVDRYRHPR
jgi:hypothetical protein